MKPFKYITAFLLLLTPITSFSISNATISQQEYAYSLKLIRELNVIVENFGTDEEKQEYEKIRENFQTAAERHYARDFITVSSFEADTESANTSTTSVDLFYELKLELLEMYNKMAQLYISRTKEILDDTAKEATDIIIEYGSGSALSKYFFGRPFNPLKDNKPYDTDKYHYFRARSSIEEYLDNGYRSLQEARLVYNDVDYQYIMTKEIKTSRELTYILEKHRAAIIICRKAKESGLEIYKILNLHDTDGIIRKYDVSNIALQRYPIYDDRLPEKYKVDATDNRKLIWGLEKRRIGNYDELNPDSVDETNPNTQRENQVNNTNQNETEPAENPQTQ
jgi:hypothetical protein